MGVNRSISVAVTALFVLLGCGGPSEERAGEKPLGTLEEADRLYTQAEELNRKGFYLKAYAAAESALAIRKARLGPGDIKLSQSLEEVGTVSLAMGRDASRGEAMLKRAVAIQKKSPEPDDHEIAWILGTLADAEVRRERVTEAQKFAREAIQYSRRAARNKENLMGRSLYILGSAQILEGNLQMAETNLRQSIALVEGTTDGNVRILIPALNDLCEVRIYRAAFRDARKVCDRALSVSERSLGPDHPYTALGLQRRAMLHVYEEEYDQALPLFERALVISENRAGPDSPLVGDIVLALANVQVARNEPKRAEPLYRRALSIQQSAYGADSPRVATILQEMGLLYQFQRKFSLAEPLYRRALRIREEALGQNHPDTGETLALLGIYYVMRGNCPRGSALIERAVAILKNDPFERTRLMAEARQAQVIAKGKLAADRARRP